MAVWLLQKAGRFKRKKRESESFMSGVLVLSISTVIVKVIGLAYKIPMLSYLGAEGMGLFHSAYEIYAMLCVVSTAGLPVALSMLISVKRQRGDLRGMERTRRVAMSVFFVLGAFGALGMSCCSAAVSQWIGNEEACFSIVAIAPALFFVCIASAYRGYFQGLNRMGPTAVSQLIEAVGKLVFGVIFARWAVKKGWELPWVSAAAITGISLGALLSVLYLFVVRHLCNKEKTELTMPSDSVKKAKSASDLLLLLRISIPITLSASVFSITRISDMALIMRRLQTIGVSVTEANRIYGAYTTLSLPVFSLIPALITPISLALVPQLSAAIESGFSGRQESVVERSLKMTTLLSIPAGMGICVYANPILSMLFPSEQEAISLAAPLLSILGPSILFSGMITTTNAMLQSYRKETKPILSMTIGAVVKIVSAYWLIGNPSVGVIGAPISTFLCNGTVTLLNLRFLRDCFPEKRIPASVGTVFYKPLIASALSVGLSFVGYLWVVERGAQSTTAGFLVACTLATVSYFVLAIFWGLLTREDLSFIKIFDRKNTERKYKNKKGYKHDGS